MRNVVLFSVAGLLLAASSAQAQWGTLKGKVVLDGEVPDQKLLVRKGDANVKDAAICSAQDVPDDSLLIDKETKGVANVLVWMVKKPSKIHPDLAKPADPKVLFDQVGCRFTPHILVVQAGQTVQVVSGDATGHNTRGNPQKNTAFNFVVAANDRVGNPVATKVAERLPVPVTCDIHNWMKAHWLIIDHPYAAVTDEKGEFEIAFIPAGEHEFRIWHENPGYLVKDPKDPKKAPKYTIKSDEVTEIPEVKVTFDRLSGKTK